MQSYLGLLKERGSASTGLEKQNLDMVRLKESYKLPESERNCTCCCLRVSAHFLQTQHGLSLIHKFEIAAGGAQYVSGAVRVKYFRCGPSFNPLHMRTVSNHNHDHPRHHLISVHRFLVLSHTVLGFRTFYKTGRAGNNHLLRQDKNLKPEKISPLGKDG